ncbi:MAG: SAVED domain-containing protein, partial [Acidobacteria bacterium]|nr:SAVED domain-containing protein [Acidobacteriota bacterium]
SRFAVFPLGPVSACIYLGYLLTNRPTVRLFQYHRDVQTWKWPSSDGVSPGLSIDVVKNVESPTNMAFLFELSFRIDRSRIISMLPNDTRSGSIGTPDPQTSWLRDPRQIRTLGAETREVFEDCINHWPQAQQWHIIYAGPAPGGVIVGQQLNPTVTPPVRLYEYSYPNHIESLVIETSGSG